MVNKLLQLRQTIGISQAELAKQLGVSAGNISHVETGKQSLSLDLAKELIRFCSSKNLTVSLDDLFLSDLSKESVKEGE